MLRKTCLAIAVVALAGIASAFAETKEPENGPELAKFLNDKYNLGCAVGKDGKIFVASFSAREVGDVEAAIDRISKIPTIQRLQIDDAHLTKDSFKKLHKLPNLSALRLLFCKFEDRDLEGLKELLSLRELDISGTPITDAGLAFLQPLKGLGRLKLSSTKLTGSGFKHLESLPLRDLNLTATPITDDSLKYIGKIHTLRVLNLSQTRITDDGLSHLSGLYLLFKLIVNGAQTTHGGRDMFREEYTESRSVAAKRGLVPPNHPDLIIGFQ